MKVTKGIPLASVPKHLQLLNPHLFHGKDNADNQGKAPELESDSSDAALAKGELQKEDTGNFLISIVSVRKRLLDEDNLCEKYHVDCCRYAGFIPCDEPQKVQIQTSQRKALKGEGECVIIEITQLNENSRT